MTNTYLSRAELLAALTNTHEKVIQPALFAGRSVLIREITGRQRMLANQAANAENPDEPDNALYRAMLIQMAVVDPESGTPGPDGHIDPRTRTPLLTVEDIYDLADGRDLMMAELVNEIATLAALRSEDLFRGDHAADSPQRDARPGAAGTKNPARQDGDQGSGDADGGGASPGEPVQRVKNPVKRTPRSAV